MLQNGNVSSATIFTLFTSDSEKGSSLNITKFISDLVALAQTIVSDDESTGINRQNITILASNIQSIMTIETVDASFYHEWLSDCEPVLIWYNSTNTTCSEIGQNYPSCSYYNQTTQSYQDDGCYVISSANEDDLIVCECLHTTFYALRARKFEPEVNFASKEEYLAVSWDTL